MTARRRRRLRLASYALGVAGILALGYCAVVWQTARVYQQKAAREFDREMQAQIARQKAPPVAMAASAPPDGGLLGRLEIPRLRLSVMVVEGDGDGDLRRAVGHIPGTAFPGQPGNVAIAGHRDTFFRPLDSIRPHDLITLGTLRGAYRYRVVSAKVVGPRDVEVLRPGPRDELTLVTCFPFNYVGPAPKRFVVLAQKSGG